MDNKLQGLDPKLREAYERVMGTNLSTQSPAAVPQSQTAQPASPQLQTSAPTVPPAQQEPVLKEAAPQSGQPAEREKSETAKTFVTYQNPKNKASEGKKISAPILIGGIIVFFIAYVLVWIKIFGLKLPFSP